MITFIRGTGIHEENIKIGLEMNGSIDKEE